MYIGGVCDKSLGNTSLCEIYSGFSIVSYSSWVATSTRSY